MQTDVKFVRSVFKIDDLPDDNFPEIILSGRSNVGKSSFINSLFNKKSIAKTSSTPGKTQSINYYSIDNKYYLVDLPGYGYAKASKSDREKWSELTTAYLKFSQNIIHSFHFIDSRHSPTNLDIQLQELLASLNIDFTIILSKADKLNQSELASAVKETIKIFPQCIPQINLFLYSAKSGKYKKPVMQRLQSLFSPQVM